ncbi:Laminin-like protein epi-1 [Bienertia sinuspersici]
MASKADFAQKLLHDLRLRKERMATAHNSDMYGSSRQNIKGSKVLETVGPKAGSKYRGSSNSQTSTAIVQAANQIVPYGRGHQSGQVADLSMALAYAFDNRGKIKRLDIASNGAFINVLQQIGRTSMQQSLEIQWQSTNQFPTLTNLHIDEIAKGTQKLNQILRACSSGINIDKGSTDIGKELWKGAMELEQSLRMLVSLQEASENTVNQQSKSRIKLLDENGDSEDESTTASLEKQKIVERPIFSFDKQHKNTKATVQTNLQPNFTALQPLPYPEDSYSKPVRHESISSKKGSLHRRSASCGSEIQTSQATTSSKLKHNAARLPNVIAKLMGLEEAPQNMNAKLATESPVSQIKSRESDSIQGTQRSTTNADSKTEISQNSKNYGNQTRAQSNKITTLISHKKELQDAFGSNNSHKTTLDLQKLRMNKEEGEEMKNYVKESKAAILKINELQSKITHLNQDDESQKDVRKEEKIKSMKQKQQVTDATGTLQTLQAPEKEICKVAQTTQTYTPRKAKTNETQKVEEASAPLLPPQKQNRDIQHISMSYEPQGKKLKAENKTQQKENQKSELRNRERNAEKMQSSRTVARDLKNIQKQVPTKQPSAGKKKEDTVVAATKSLLNNRQNEGQVREGKSTYSNDRKKSSMGQKSDQSSPSINEVYESQRAGNCPNSSKDVKCTHNSARIMVGEIKPSEASNSTKTNVEFTRKFMSPRTMTKASKPQKLTSYRLKQSKSDKIKNSNAAAEPDKTMPKSMENRLGNDEPRNPAAYEISQNIDAKQVATKNHSVRSEHSLNLKEVTKLLPEARENTISTVSDDQQEQLVSEEVVVEPEITAAAAQEDCNNSSDQQQKPIKMDKQILLTEDEMFLKQKLITSHLFLNTAEALFKLNIPISILNYASDHIFEEKDSKTIQDCCYELLKRKGRRQGIIFPSSNMIATHTKIKSLDDLVRQLHKDVEILQSYGRGRKDEYDYVNHILNMLDSDIYNKHPDLNSMWDFGWNEVMFPCAKMDEVISSIEQLLLDELMEEL